MKTVTFKNWQQEQGAIGVALAERVFSVGLTDEQYAIYSDLTDLGYSHLTVLGEMGVLDRAKEE